MNSCLITVVFKHNTSEHIRKILNACLTPDVPFIGLQTYILYKGCPPGILSPDRNFAIRLPSSIVVRSFALLDAKR